MLVDQTEVCRKFAPLIFNCLGSASMV